MRSVRARARDKPELNGHAGSAATSRLTPQRRGVRQQLLRGKELALAHRVSILHWHTAGVGALGAPLVRRHDTRQ